MIARSQTRTTPIPFDTPAAAQPRATRAINWSGSGNPAAPSLASVSSPTGDARPGTALIGSKVSLAGHLPLSAQNGLGGLATAQHAANMPRLSPVKASLPFHSPAATAPGQASGALQTKADARAPSGRKPDARPLTEITARYTGQGSLSVRSSVTGRHYRFQGHGDCVTIDKSDVVLLRRIADLDIR